MPGMSRASPAVVFIHGIGGAARVWKSQIASFAAAGFDPVALDLPGYGSRQMVRSMDFEGLALDVERQIADRGLARPVLVGHSMGGMVVQTMLRRQPQSYGAAALVCTSPAFGNADGAFQRRFVADRLGLLEAGRTMAELAPLLVDRMMGPAAPAAARAQAVAVMSAVPAETYKAAVRCLVSFDERANLGRISIPVLCLAGEKDANVPAAVMQRMAARIEFSRYACLAGVGHLPNLEAPEAFDAAMLRFLREGISPVKT